MTADDPFSTFNPSEALVLNAGHSLPGSPFAAIDVQKLTNSRLRDFSAEVKLQVPFGGGLPSTLAKTKGISAVCAAPKMSGTTDAGITEYQGHVGAWPQTYDHTGVSFCTARVSLVWDGQRKSASVIICATALKAGKGVLLNAASG